MESFQSITSDKIIERLDDLIINRPNGQIIHTGANDLTNDVELFHNVKQILRKLLRMLFLRGLFSSIILGQIKKHSEKPLADKNARLKNFCTQKELDFIDDKNLEEAHLGKKSFI